MPPPRLTAVLWSKLGVTAPFFALVERIAPNLVRVHIDPADKEIAGRVHIERSPLRESWEC